MCLICDHRKQLQNIGKEIGGKLAKTPAPPEMISAAARSAADYVYDAILHEVAISDMRRIFAHPTAQKALITTYGDERTKEINDIVTNVESLEPEEIIKKIESIRAEVDLVMGAKPKPKTEKALTVKGFMPPESDPNLN